MRSFESGEVIIRQAGEIIGRTRLMLTVHAEQVWIHPDHQGRVGVWRQLRKGIEESALSAFGSTGVFVSATHGVIQKFMRKVGIRVPGETYVWALKQPR